MDAWNEMPSLDGEDFERLRRMLDNATPPPKRRRKRSPIPVNLLTLTEAAELVGRHPATVRKWMTEPSRKSGLKLVTAARGRRKMCGRQSGQQLFFRRADVIAVAGDRGVEPSPLHSLPKFAINAVKALPKETQVEVMRALRQAEVDAQKEFEQPPPKPLAKRPVKPQWERAQEIVESVEDLLEEFDCAIEPAKHWPDEVLIRLGERLEKSVEMMRQQVQHLGQIKTARV